MDNWLIYAGPVEGCLICGGDCVFGLPWIVGMVGCPWLSDLRAVVFII